jgi:hypothetical protein
VCLLLVGRQTHHGRHDDNRMYVVLLTVCARLTRLMTDCVSGLVVKERVAGEVGHTTTLRVLVF